LKKVQPVYPPQAKFAHIQGTVTFAAVIGTDGAIRELYVVSGDQSLAKAAWDAVRQWHYKPFLYHGRAVAFDTRILVNFFFSY
jgi:protein TonB